MREIIPKNELTRFKVKYCEECNQCWEWGLGRCRIRHYKDFPTYGMPHKTCIKCKEKINAVNIEIRKLGSSRKGDSR